MNHAGHSAGTGFMPAKRAVKSSLKASICHRGTRHSLEIGSA
eukprot:CAMPEP_0181498464 /NCGR_PEP_ID=MMETSP1110-20121109/54115_1 /TAXON_ID=174948 /ORGANISM="Symbiodinium sp., Strain CCMP421" /LENGTH=41 /DNA_ID= /DNA_START= /DNA_END= /DNA_ORIENTATION=